MSQSFARSRLNLPSDVPVVLFLASAGISDTRKGWDLLAPALAQVSDNFPDLHVIVAGPDPDAVTKRAAAHASKASIHWRGSVTSDADLRELYAAADLVAVPSREDNLPLTAMEAHACGRPVVGFATGGLYDIVVNGSTGYVVSRQDAGLLAGAITKCLEDSASTHLSDQARQRALTLWAPQHVSLAYTTVYESLGSSSRS